MIRFGSLLGYSMPVFWLGLVGLLLFYAKLGWVEGPGRLDVSYDDIVPTVTGLITIDSLIAGEYDVFWNALSHLVLPASILGYLSLAYVARMTRSFMLGSAQAGIRAGDAGQGIVAVPRGLGPRARQCLGAAGDRHRADLRQPARRRGADRDGVRLARTWTLHEEFACSTPISTRCSAAPW